MYFEYEGIKVYYEVQGVGADLLLLHGWGCTHKIFDSFMPDLLAKHRVISLDFPGFGLSQEPLSVWGVEDYTLMVEALCMELNIVEPSILCHSFGGRVAIVFASRNKVRRMLFADAAGIKPRRGPRYYLKVYSYKLAKWWLLKVVKKRDAYEKMRCNRGSSDYRNASDWMKAILSKCVGQDLRMYLPKIKAPVLLFWGENDSATPLRDARIMERMIPDSGLVMVKGGSHFSFLDDPSLFRSMIHTFLV
ncbi:MAG TPA: alpha/beta hydrolase [Rikenellaceae bacterium]|nr:alpha/beta hydrolase [Rikenellaceae bacterium]